ncbi:MAG: zeta toxin family protein [Bacteroidales bacterium]|nr:zeta toxin family protein [Bacteroidales bacterium]
MPRMFIISGCNGSGKTTASYQMLPEMLECREFVNSDEFAKYLSPFDPNAAAVSASRYMLLKINYLLERNLDFGLETTLATKTLVRIIERAKKQGYTITLLYFWLNSPELALKRVAARVAAGGHNIDEDTIRRRYDRGLHYFFETYAPLCDKWVLCDNSNPPFSVIAEGGNDGLIIRDSAKYYDIWEKINDTQ